MVLPDSRYDRYFRQYTDELFQGNVHWHWLKALAIAESSLDPDAVSLVGAAGIMQLMPATAAEMAEKMGCNGVDIFDPETNIRLGIGYAARCYKIFSKEKGLERVRFMIAAYNAGPGHIIEAQRITAERGVGTDVWEKVSPSLIRVTGDRAFETLKHVMKVEMYYRELQ